MSIYDDAKITNPYGAPAPDGTSYALGYHTGIDLVFSHGLIRPVVDGVVEETGFNKDYGNYVMVKNEDGYFALYSHLKSIFVDKGDKVKTLSILGTQGSTGQATGEHLHLEIRADKDSQASNVDPEAYLSGQKNFSSAFYKTKEEAENASIINQLKRIPDFFDGVQESFENFGENLKNNALRLGLILIAGLLLFIVVKSTVSGG